MRALIRSGLVVVLCCVALMWAGAATAGVVCQGTGWSVTGDVGWKPSTKQVKDIISKAKDRSIPGNFSCCNKVGAEDRVCQDYREDANGNVAEVGVKHERTPRPADGAPSRK